MGEFLGFLSVHAHCVSSQGGSSPETKVHCLGTARKCLSIFIILGDILDYRFPFDLSL